jgi:N-carbamoylputrescine amidase
LRGAEIIFYPTAIGWHPKEKNEFGNAQHSSWELIQRSHAIANGCYDAAANRVGQETPAAGDGIEFWGQSFICGPDGEIIAKGAVDREEIVMGDVDWSAVDRHRTHWPFLRDRRVDAYAGLEQRLLDS